MHNTFLKAIATSLLQETLLRESLFRNKENYLHIVRAEKGFLAISITKDEAKILREKAILKLCRKRGLPVPWIVLYQRAKFSHGQDLFCAVKKIEGEPLAGKKLHIFEYNRVLTDLAQVLLKLHQIECKGFGFLSPQLNGRRENWQKFITENLDDELLFFQQQRIFSKSFIQQMTYYLHFEPISIVPMLLHGNLSIEDLFINKELRVATLTISDHPLAGDPNWDLAGFLLNEGFDHAERLIKLYYLLGGTVEWDSEKFLKTALRRSVHSLYWKLINKHQNITGNKKMIIQLVERSKLLT